MGPLIDARGRDHAEAFKEVGLNVLLSTLPIWLGALIMSAVAGTVVSNFLQNLRSGELYLYSTAMLAPLYYFLFKEYHGSSSQFPGARLFMIICLLLAVMAAGLFAFRTSRSLFGGTIQVDEKFIFAWSIVLYGISILLAYLAYVLKNFLETGASDLQRTTTADFVREFTTREKGK